MESATATFNNVKSGTCSHATSLSAHQLCRRWRGCWRNLRVILQTFGFHRIEMFGALASVMLIWVLTGVLVYEAVLRILNPEEASVHYF